MSFLAFTGYLYNSDVILKLYNNLLFVDNEYKDKGKLDGRVSKESE